MTTVSETKISSRQFLFAMICFLQGSAILNAFVSNITYHESWLVFIFAFIVFIPILFLYSALIKRFKNKNLIQIIIHIFGPIFGRIIGVLYILFFLSLSFLNLTDLIHITSATMLETTPSYILLTMCVLVIAWSVRSGLRVLTIYGKLFTFLASLIIIGSMFLLLNVLEVTNLFPIFNLKLKNYIQGTHILTSIPFADLIVFLMITPNVEMKKKDVNKYLFLGVSLGALSFLLTLLRDIMALGETFSIFIFPSIVAFRLIHITEAITRIEILFIVILIILLFFKISIIYYATVISVAQIFNLDKYKNIVLSVGLLLITAALAVTANPIEQALAAQNGIPFLWVFLEFIIPLILLLISVIFKIKTPYEEES